MNGVRGRGRIGAPFAYQTVDALAAIEETFEGRKLTTALALYVALTRIANDEGSTRFNAEQKEVARRSGTTTRTVREYAPELERAGVLVIHHDAGGPYGWELVEPRKLLPGSAETASGGDRKELPGGPETASGVHVTKGEEQQKNSTSSSTARAWPVEASEDLVADGEALLKAKQRVDGRVVTEGEMTIAAAALSEFNRQADSGFGLGASLTPLVMRIRERPSYDAAAHVRLVQSAFRIRWWEQSGRRGRPAPGVIYGNARCFENVVQDAIDEQKGRASEVARSPRQAREQAKEDRQRRRMEAAQRVKGGSA